MTRDTCYIIAARKIGIPLSRYIELRASGKKRCVKCRRWLIAEWFYRNRFRHDGLSADCIRCNRESSRVRKMRRERMKKGQQQT